MKIIFKYLKFVLSGILILIFAYLFIAIILSIIPVNSDFKEFANSKFELWIISNGMHLDIVFPLQIIHPEADTIMNVPTEFKDEVKFIGFGWGDKAFFTTTPEWSDLKFTTAFSALFFRTEGALHITYYRELTENEKNIKLFIKEDEFIEVQDFIMNSFKIENENKVLLDDIQYGVYDRFYDANIKYSILYTCNSWTNEALKKAGLPACAWTPFDKGVLFQYRKYIQK